MNVFKLLIIVMLFSINAFACALCALYSPTAHVSTNFETNATHVKNIKFIWSFSENFSSLMLQGFDANGNDNLEGKELREVRQSLIEYLVPERYLTHLAYFYNDKNENQIRLETIDYELKFTDKRLSFEVIFALDLQLRDKLTISAEIFDPGGYFHFKFEPSRTHELKNGEFFTQNSNSNIAFFELTDAKSAKKFDALPHLNDLVSSQGEQELVAKTTQQEPKLDFSEIDAIDAQKMDAISRSSLNLLERAKILIKSDQKSALLWLALVCFGYGAAHAAGPGHAKGLAASYFAANGGSAFVALKFAMRVGFIHIFGSFLLVFISIFAFEKILPNERVAAQATSIICGVLIVLIAVFMLYKILKLKQTTCSCAICSSKQPNESKIFKNAQFNQPKQSKFGSINFHHTTKTQPKSALAVSALAALAPCPGVIMVFLLAHEVQGYVAGAIAGLFIALGMSVVIFCAAMLGASVHNKFFEQNSLKYIQILALLAMATLGVMMIYQSFGGLF